MKQKIIMVALIIFIGILVFYNNLSNNDNSVNNVHADIEDTDEYDDYAEEVDYSDEDGEKATSSAILYEEKNDCIKAGDSYGTYEDALKNIKEVIRLKITGNSDGNRIYKLPRWNNDKNNICNETVRATTVNASDFKDGDILIYEYKPTEQENNVALNAKEYRTTNHTYENGLYAYIFIDGKFVGINGNDDTRRDAFTYQ